MGCILCTIIILLWTAWAYYAITSLNKIFSTTLKHLFEPKVNIYAKNASASRYDAIEVKKLQVYIGAIFLFPIRLLTVIPIVLGGMGIGKIICLVFNCKSTP